MIKLNAFGLDINTKEKIQRSRSTVKISIKNAKNLMEIGANSNVMFDLLGLSISRRALTVKLIHTKLGDALFERK